MTSPSSHLPFIPAETLRAAAFGVFLALPVLAVLVSVCGDTPAANAGPGKTLHSPHPNNV